MVIFKASTWLFVQDNSKVKTVIKKYKINPLSVDFSNPESVKDVKTSIKMNEPSLNILNLDDIELITSLELKEMMINQTDYIKDDNSNNDLLEYFELISDGYDFIYAKIKIRKQRFDLKSKSIFYTYVLHKTLDSSIKLREGELFLNVKKLELSDYVEITDNRDITTDYNVTIYPSKLTIFGLSLLLLSAGSYLVFRNLKK